MKSFMTTFTTLFSTYETDVRSNDAIAKEEITPFEKNILRVENNFATKLKPKIETKNAWNLATKLAYRLNSYKFFEFANRFIG